MTVLQRKHRWTTRVIIWIIICQSDKIDIRPTTGIGIVAKVL
jgi:hypothetical protein